MGAVHGSVEIEASGAVPGYSPWEKLRQVWSQLSEAEFNSHLPREAWGQLRPGFFQSTNSSILDVAAYAYDAVATAGLAACATVPHNSLEDGDALMRNLKALDFAGVSGHVQFSSWASRTGETGNFFILNIRRMGQRLTSVTSGRYVAASHSFDYTCESCTGDGILFSDGTTPPSDRWPYDEDDNTVLVAVVLTLSALLLLGLGAGFTYRNSKIASGRQKKAIIQSMQEELQQLKDSLVGMLVLKQDWAPGYRIQDQQGQTFSQQTGDYAPQTSDHVVLHVGLNSVNSAVVGRWYWEESPGQEHLHPTMDGMFVPYDKMVSMHIEDCWQRWVDANRDTTLGVFEITVRAVPYKINLNETTQTRISTNFVRKLRRKETVVDRVVSSIQRKGSDPSITGGGPAIPHELLQETLLVAFEGTLVQVSKSRNDGWSYGNVVFNPNDSPPSLQNDSWSLESGWFPDGVCRAPNPKDLEQLNAKLGSGAADCLKVPSSWTPVKDPLLAECLPASASEVAEVTTAFMATVPSGATVKGVERVQNVSMWQTYAVKRQTILSREQGVDSGRLERRWLFHGTNTEVLDKIIQQGFNRSFCGKNATMYGKGVYFARDARYSCSKTYSVPDSCGVQHMFACRVTVGEYVGGVKDALTPGVRVGNVLYDSTVDVMDDPNLFVCYHDSQAYPDYIIHFTT